MEFSRIKPNYDMFVIDQSKKKSIFKKIYYSNEIEQLQTDITDFCESKYDDAKIFKIKLCNLKDLTTKQFELKFHNVEVEEASQMLFRRLVKYKTIKDPKLNKYYLSVRNASSKVNDTKMLSFNSEYDFLRIYVQIKEFYKNYIENNNEIQFFKTNKKKTSHYIILSKVNPTNRAIRQSKSFAICLNNYSSEEVVQLLEEQNGK